MIEVNYLMNYTYAKPAQLKVVVMADQASSWFPKDIGSMKRISPDESHHAFVMATARDLAQNKSEIEWKNAWRSSVATFVRLERHEDAFWRAGKERELIGANFDTMYYTTAGPSAVTALPSMSLHCQPVFGKTNFSSLSMLVSMLLLLLLLLLLLSQWV